jgi:hypothetical protein
MAHAPATKAKAMAMLLTGDAPAHVARELGIPLGTCKRWQKEASGHLQGVIGPEDRAALAELGRDVAEFFPGLVRKR